MINLLFHPPSFLVKIDEHDVTYDIFITRLESPKPASELAFFGEMLKVNKKMFTTRFLGFLFGGCGD